jgi:molybdopterin converting factor small subunit
MSAEIRVNCAGIAKDNIKIAFINNKIVGLDTVLSDDDRIGLAPSVGGI